MQTNSKLWIIQNQLLLSHVAVAALLGILLLLFATKVMPDVLRAWLPAAPSNQPTLAEVESEIAAERIQGEKLKSRLNSLKADDKPQETFQAVLAVIQERCNLQQVSLHGYDWVPQNHRSSDNIASYRLLVEGRFHAITLLLADLEALPFGLTIQSLSLEVTSPDSQLLRGVFEINTGSQ